MSDLIMALMRIPGKKLLFLFWFHVKALSACKLTTDLQNPNHSEAAANPGRGLHKIDPFHRAVLPIPGILPEDVERLTSLLQRVKLAHRNLAPGIVGVDAERHDGKMMAWPHRTRGDTGLKLRGGSV